MILLFTVFTPRDLELLFAVGVSDGEVREGNPAENLAEAPEAAVFRASRSDLIAHANFSQREAEVFELLMNGYTIRLISQELHISQSTVKTHISKIYLKTNVSTREELLIKLKEETNVFEQ